MARSDPQPGDTITLGSKTYEFLPHPIFADAAYGQEGRKGVVYQLRNNGDLYALKSFRKSYRDSSLRDICTSLAQLELSGMEICRRDCLTDDWAGEALCEFPDFEYAVLMPWIEGSTWFELIVERTVLDRGSSIAIARNTCDVLAKLENRGFAHCDVSGSNVIVHPQTGAIHFIDVEDMHGPGLALESAFPQGSAGYQHPANPGARQGQWCIEGDRFAGGVLLAEMLTWHEPEVRAKSDREHFFAESEMQKDGERFQLMLAKLGAISKGLAACFRRVWEAETLADCPRLGEWRRLLELSVVTCWQPIEPPPPRPPYRPKFMPLQVSGLPAPYVWAPVASSPVSLRWQPVPGATGYVVEISQDGTFADAVEIYRGPQTQYDGVEVSGASIVVRVRAFDASCQSAWQTLKVSVRG